MKFFYLHLKQNLDLKLVEINIIGLTVLLYLFRTTLPALKFPFILLFIGMIIYSIIKYGRKMLQCLKEFIKRFYLPIILLIILIISFSLSCKLYLIVFKDVINSVILIVLFYLMTVIITSKSELNIFIASLKRSMVFFAVLIAFSLLLNFHHLFFNGYEQYSNNVRTIPLLGDISADYNFALIPLFFGMITVLCYLIEPRYTSRIFLFNLILLFLSLPILLSGSRRGILSFSVLIIFLIIIQIFHYNLKNDSIRNIAINSRSFLKSILVLTFLLAGFIFLLPVNIQKKTLSAFGISIDSYREFTSPLLFKYSTFFSNREYSHYRRAVLREKQDPLNPDSGWGKKISKRAFPLAGENVGIVPENSIGYKMDSTCEASSWSNNAYSYTDISGLLKEERSAEDNEWYFSSIYCYVSNDFDGDWAYIFTENATSGKSVHPYDFKKKGVWQKLTICFKSKGDIPRVYLYWAKSGVTDFSRVKGYIIFTYPEYKLIKAESKDPIVWGTRTSSQVYPLSGENVGIVPKESIGYKMDNTSDASTWANNAYSFTNISVLFQGDTTNSKRKSYHASVYCFVSEDFDGSWANISTEGMVSGDVIDKYDLSKKGSWQKLQINFTSESAIPPVYLYWAKGGVTDFRKLQGYVIFAFPEYSILSLKSSISLRSAVYQLPSTVPFFASEQLKASLFEPVFPIIKNVLLTGIDHDLIRKWTARLITEDTAYYSFKSNLVVGNVSNRLIGDRIMKWKFAGKIFLLEYNWKEKLFGGGFNFLNWYGFYFLKNKTSSDYPHNPFLSVLLYSGLFGLIIYLLFLYEMIYFYIRYMGEYFILLFFFIITFLFSFFSAGSPFDPPIMGFFVMLPFFLNLVHKKQNFDKILE